MGLHPLGGRCQQPAAITTKEIKHLLCEIQCFGLGLLFFLPQVKILNYIEMALLQIEDNELSKCTKRKDKKNAVVKENVLGEDG